MKILQINKFFYVRGGAERHYFDLIDLLESHGHEVVHFSMQDPRNKPSPYARYFVSNLELEAPGMRTLRSVGRFFYSREAARNLEAFLDATRPDIAHVHLIYHHLSPSVLDVLRKRKIPVVFTIHDWKLLCPNYTMFARGEICEHCMTGKSTFFSTVAHRCVKNSYALSTLAALEAWFNKKRYQKTLDALIAPSHFVADMFVRAGWPAAKMHTLYHPTPLPERVTKKDATTVLYAGRLSEEKGIRFLVEAWVRERVPYTLAVAGTGPLEQNLVKIAQQSQKSNIIFKGFLNKKELEDEFCNAACVVVPSLWYETFGLSVVEALSYGVPVVTTNHGAQAELITVSKGGVTRSPHDAKAFVQAVTELMHNHDKRADLGAHGRRFVEHSLSKELYYDELMKVYEETLKKYE